MLYFYNNLPWPSCEWDASRGSQTPGRTLQKGKLKGVVVDWQDARMPGTPVEIQSSEFRAEVKTSEAGEFETDLPMGIYEVSVQREGFEKFHQKSVKVDPSNTT